MRLRGIFFSLLFTTIVVACGATTNSTPNDGGKEESSSPCTPGQQINCGCSVGQGVQVCKADGSGYGPCQCADGGVVESGKDSGGDSTVIDGGHDSGGDGACECGDGATNSGQDAPTDTGMKDTSTGDAGCTLSTADAGPGGTLNFAENFGTTGTTDPTALAVDPSSGDLVVVGYFTGTINFGGGLVSSADDAGSATGAFVAKFDSSGAYKWAKTFSNGMTTMDVVAIESSGNIAIGGEFTGTISFGGPAITSIGAEDIFIANFDATGTFRWSEGFGAAGKFQQVNSIVFNTAGDVLIAGDGDDLDLGGGAGTGDYIGWFDSTGAYKWSNNFPATTTSGGPYLAFDPLGDMIYAGNFATTIDLGGGTLTSAGGDDIFVAQFDPSGGYVWAKQYGDIDDQEVSAVAVDACGSILATGVFGGTINFGTGTLTANPVVENIFLAKIDSTGNGVWADPFAGSGADTFGSGPRSVAVDGAGRPILTCYLSGSVNYGGGMLTSVASASVSIASFDVAGAYRWAYAGGSPSTAGESEALGLAASSAGIFVTGQFGTCSGSCTTSPPGTTLVLAGKTLTATSAYDMFLASFTP